MQGIACVTFLAHGAHHCQYALTIITDQVLTRRICHRVVITDFLPLFDAFRTKAVLTRATFFSVEYDHLADTAYEMLVKWLCTTLISIFLCSSRVFIFRRDADEISRINLHYSIISNRLATCHYLVNLFVAENEKAIGVLLARSGDRGLRLALTYGVQLVSG